MPKTKDTASSGTKLYKTILRYDRAANVAAWAGRVFACTFLGYVLVSIISVFAAHAVGEVTGFIYVLNTVLTFLNPLALFLSMWIGSFADVPFAMAAACTAEMAAYAAVFVVWLYTRAACRPQALAAAPEGERRGAADMLVERLKARRRLSARLLMCLADLHDPRAVDALAALLEHRHMRVRLAAAQALARTGDYRAVKPLEALRAASTGGSRQAKAADRAVAQLLAAPKHVPQAEARGADELPENVDRSAFTTVPFNSFAAGKKLMAEHGSPKEILLRQDAVNPGLLEAVLTFADDSKYALGGFSAGTAGMRQEFLLKLLGEAGLNVLAEELCKMNIPNLISRTR